MLVVSWFSCPDTKYCIFYKDYIEGAVFAHFGVEKMFFSQQKYIRLQVTGKRNLPTKLEVSTTKTVGD